MKLHLLRHADPEIGIRQQSDFDRKLSSKGILQLPKISTTLKKRTDFFKHLEIYCSPSKRTMQTVEGATEGISELKINYVEELYLPTIDKLLSFLNHLNTSKDILIVGHNPGLSQLASYFSGQQIVLSPGDLITLDFEINHSVGFSGDTASIIN